MADISTELARILSAIYGEDVRGSIHDAIEKINDVSEKVIDAGTAVTSASSSSTGYYTDSLYVNTGTNDLWRCMGTDTWALIGNLEGAQGETGNGIESIELTSTSGLVDTYTITYTDGSTSSFTIHNGAVPTITINATADALSSDTPTVTVTRTGTTDAPIFSMAFSGLKGQQGVQGIQGETGETGNGIASIAKTSTSGKVDTYTITMTDGSTATFTVTNGEDGHGAGDMLQSAYDPDLDVYNAGGIVDYVSAHAALYSAGANINISSGHVISVTGLATVATSGSYNDLSDKPTIPAAVAVKGDAETTYRTGNVNLTKANIGLGNVGNFKAVSTVASQGLSDTEKSNARANIGAGTSSSDTKNTAGTTNSTSKLFLAGATSQAANPQTYSNVNCYASGGYLYSNGQKVSTDNWTETKTVSSNGTVSFSGLNDSYGYKIYYTLPSGDSAYTFSKVTKSGSGTSVTLTYTTDAPSGTVCKLRILK